MENNNQEKSCKKCNQKGPGAIQIGSIILGFYVLFSSIYGTIEIIKSIVSWVKLSFGI